MDEDQGMKTIEPGKRSLGEILVELWGARDLAWTLAKRDLKVQYSRAYLGILWAILKPVLALLILSFVFGRLAKVGTGGTGVPHIIYTGIGLLGWTFFADIVSGASNALIGFQEIIKKIYFPRIIIPLYRIIVTSLDFLVLLAIVILLLFWFGIDFKYTILYLPLVLVLITVLGIAGSLWVAGLSIRYADIKHVMPTLLRVGMYLSPVAYSTQLVPDDLLMFYYINPIAGIIDLLRWSLIGEPIHNYVFISILSLIIITVTGLWYFRSIEKKVVDLL